MFLTETSKQQKTKSAALFQQAKMIFQTTVKRNIYNQWYIILNNWKNEFLK